MSATGVVLRVRRGGLVVLTALVAGALLAACAAEPAPPKLPVTIAPKPKPTATPDPEPTEEAWARFSDPRLPHSFEIPPGWTVADLGGDPAYGVFQFGVVNPEGRQLLTFANRVQGLGGSCGDLPALIIEEVDTRAVALPGYAAATDARSTLVPPRVVYRVSEVAGGALASLSLSDDKPADACMYYNLLNTDSGLAMFATQLQVDSYAPTESAWFFDSAAAAEAYAETDEYQQLVRVLTSLSFSA